MSSKGLLWLISSGHELSVYKVLAAVNPRASRTGPTSLSAFYPVMLPGKYLSRDLRQSALLYSKSQGSRRTKSCASDLLDAVEDVVEKFYYWEQV